MRRLILASSLLLLALSPVAAAELDSLTAQRWIGIPDLTTAAIDSLIADFELRGTYGDLTLAVGDREALQELRRRHPQAVEIGALRPHERVYSVLLAPGESLLPAEGARLLWRSDIQALVGLTDDSSAELSALLSEGRTGLFHGGVALVSDRRQRPQRMRPASAGAVDFDPQIQTWVDQVSDAQLETDVTSLSTIFSTRRSDNSEGHAAEQWLVDRFEALGLATTTHSFDSGADNVIAELPGEIEPEKVVIVGAHYDSVSGNSSEAPGADDNASGTAALLEIARILAGENASFRYTLRLIAFASEEFGLVGSDAYSQLMLNQGVDVVAMLNTDMNAYRKSGDALDLDMVTNNTTTWLNDLLIEISNLYVPALPTRKGSLGGGTSDHHPFYNDGFPAAFYFEDTSDYSPYIHSSNDVVHVSANDFTLAFRIVQSVLAGAATMAEPVDGTPSALLTVTGTCPGRLTMEMTDVTPGAEVSVYMGRREGSSTLRSGACTGTTTGLNRPRLIGRVTADSGGTAVMNKRFRASRCGLFLQAVDDDSCATTNVVQAP